ncbi:MAG: type VI secretion system tip protein TssI/VgrG [Alcanivorax sp.]|nr:type VI secretion system tip protein TssI/VgrG [Alcanivorax sp.]
MEMDKYLKTGKQAMDKLEHGFGNTGEAGSASLPGMETLPAGQGLTPDALGKQLSSTLQKARSGELSLDSVKHSVMGALKQAAVAGSAALMARPLCRFFIDVAGMGEEALAVESFQSRDWALSSLSRLQVDVLARVEPQLGSLPGEPATLRVTSNVGQDSAIALMVEAVEELPASPEGSRLRLHLASPLFPLSLNRHNRVFLNRDLKQIIEQVMSEAGISADQLTIEFSRPQPARPMVVQYEENDLTFLQRLLARDGAFYTVEASDQGGRFHFYDDSNALQDALGSVRLDYHPESGQAPLDERIYQVNRTLRWMAGTVTLEDRNPQTPDRPPRGQAEGLGGHGEQYHWGPHASDGKQANALAKIRMEVIDVQRQTVVASADTAQLRPGMQLQLAGHPQYDGPWLVSAVQLEGDQRVGHAFGQQSDRPGLLSTLTLVPASFPFRAATPWQRPPVHGSFSALVEGDGGDYAYLDDQGCYRIRLPFDLSDSPQGEATPPVRLMQPYGGPDSGMHLPLHAGTEVLLSCVNGDIDRPVILGALSNPNTPSPVTGANPSQHILRTRSGNELLMEDRAGEERIELFTGERKNRLALDAREDAHQVTLESTEGDMLLRAGGHMTTEVEGSRNTRVGEDQTVTVTRDLKLMTREGEVMLQAGTDLLFRAGQHLHLAADQGDMQLTAGGNLLTRSKGDSSLEVINGNASLVVARGGLGFDVEGAITLRGAGNAPIRLSQAGGTIEISPDGDLTLDASQIEISGSSIKINGQQVGNN